MTANFKAGKSCAHIPTKTVGTYAPPVAKIFLRVLCAQKNVNTEITEGLCALRVGAFEARSTWRSPF
jgi:hypothetical protein